MNTVHSLMHSPIVNMKLASDFCLSRYWQHTCSLLRRFWWETVAFRCRLYDGCPVRSRSVFTDVLSFRRHLMIECQETGIVVTDQVFEAIVPTLIHVVSPVTATNCRFIHVPCCWRKSRLGSSHPGPPLGPLKVLKLPLTYVVSK